ncbi:uncharacterized protein EAF01_006750 [Botrytis porri]|uniref:Uncharacterized protein n=1 Tax=Botrytis porri TaxID=87229 RepID=A0A4Z1KRR4_9HELO|nr:uncharacterized protein EAF01_006750 [Botrytis porri]KAF7903701.1 hypothetical protein EAF01_006750 [Botrytis porri]TGO87204.1 hypothetical protein BPOR_0242g00020 [Botrytis porri]
MNGNHSNRNRSTGNLSNGKSSNGNRSNGNRSNKNSSNGNSSNVNRSKGNLSNENISNGSSHSSAPQTDWKNLFQIKKSWLEKCQAELQDSQLKCLQAQEQRQEQRQELQESYKELHMAWQNLWTVQERDWQLRAESARAYHEFQTAYEEERKHRPQTEQARKIFHNMLQRVLQLGNGTAQNAAGDSNPFNTHIGRNHFETLVQLTVPNQSPPSRPTLNPAAPVFSKPRDDTRAHSADSAYQSSSSQEGGSGDEPETSNDLGTVNSSDITSPPTPPTPLTPTQTLFRIPLMLPKFPRRHNSDSYLTEMRAGRASTPE